MKLCCACLLSCLPLCAAAFDLSYPQPVSRELVLPRALAQVDPSQAGYLPGSQAKAKMPAFESLLPNPKDSRISEAAELLGPDSAPLLASFPVLMQLLESPEERLSSLARAALFSMLDSDEAAPLFVAVDERSDWEREGLKGSPSLRRDYVNGSDQPFSEIRYDSRGRRVSEALFDSLPGPSFRRVTTRGPGACPSHIQDFDASGIQQREVRFVLNADGRPSQERHFDSKGQPLFSRSFIWDQGRLTEFQDQKSGAFPLRLRFSYDPAGHLRERRAFARNNMRATPDSEYFYDAAGNTLEHREWIENLPLSPLGGGIQISQSQQDPRRALKYRWVYELDDKGRPESAKLYASLREESELLTRHYHYNDSGLLTAWEETDRMGLLLRRLSWDYSKEGAVQRLQSGGSKLPYASQSIDYDFDAQGNWIQRRTLGSGPDKRVFEYGK